MFSLCFSEHLLCQPHPELHDANDRHHFPQSNNRKNLLRLLATCYHNPQHHFQRWGLDPNLVPLQPHIHLTFENPSHRGWQISAWSTNTYQRPPPPMPSLPHTFTQRMGFFGYKRIHES
ncbi:unnamed protein product [Schistocephalus solidus]|uniref:Uncharacterized protein n=1 Tax=Schistocephalus solidus TaxID=70667 RepID=A0A183SFB6_SCHSO|nr:unnamed protein product [Schistocephalus solidus]